MSDPVATAGGFVYDRNSIETWFNVAARHVNRQGRRVWLDPMSNAELLSRELKPLPELKGRIDAHRATLAPPPSSSHAADVTPSAPPLPGFEPSATQLTGPTPSAQGPQVATAAALTPPPPSPGNNEQPTWVSLKGLEDLALEGRKNLDAELGPRRLVGQWTAAIIGGVSTATVAGLGVASACGVLTGVSLGAPVVCGALAGGVVLGAVTGTLAQVTTNALSLRRCGTVRRKVEALREMATAFERLHEPDIAEQRTMARLRRISNVFDSTGGHAMTALMWSAGAALITVPLAMLASLLVCAVVGKKSEQGQSSPTFVSPAPVLHCDYGLGAQLQSLMMQLQWNDLMYRLDRAPRFRRPSAPLASLSPYDFGRRYVHSTQRSRVMMQPGWKVALRARPGESATA